MGRIVLDPLDMPSWCTVDSHVIIFSDLLLLLCAFCLVAVRLNLLVDLVCVHRSLSINTLLASYCKPVKSWCIS
jgi:hypothetical protein